MWGGDASLPPQVRRNYSEGQRAVYAVYSNEIAKFGRSTNTVANVAKAAGVSRRWVQKTLRLFEADGLLGCLQRPAMEFGRRVGVNLTNVVTIVRKELIEWARRLKLKVGRTDVRASQRSADQSPPCGREIHEVAPLYGT